MAADYAWKDRARSCGHGICFGVTDKIAELEKLASLHERKLLSDAEFKREKSTLLATRPHRPTVKRPIAVLSVLALVGVSFVAWMNLRSPNERHAGPYNNAQTAVEAAHEPQTQTSWTLKAESPVLEAHTPNSVPEIGNCHMGECSWSKLQVFTGAGRSPLGSLFRLELLGGISEQGSADGYPKSYSDTVKIKWDKHSHVVYVFCSKQLPSVILKTDGKSQIDVLDFTTPDGIPDALISSANLYSSTCHLNPSAWTAPEFASRYGYQSPARFSGVSISRPKDILNVR